MSQAKDRVLAALNVTDVLATERGELRPRDLQGWNSRHAFLTEAIARRPAPVVVEVGVWKGGSTISMAKELATRWADGVVVAVDTFLGSAEHHLNPDWRASLQAEHGYPTLYRTFIDNVQHDGVSEYVVPLPLDSINAAHLIRQTGITADVIHIDAGHDFESVSMDLALWIDVLAVGGILICDDYAPAWPGVVRAVDELSLTGAVAGLRASGDKAWLEKTGAAPRDQESETMIDLESDVLRDALRQRGEALERLELVEQQNRALVNSRVWRWTKWIHH